MRLGKARSETNELRTATKQQDSFLFPTNCKRNNFAEARKSKRQHAGHLSMKELAGPQSTRRTSHRRSLARNVLVMGHDGPERCQRLPRGKGCMQNDNNLSKQMQSPTCYTRQWFLNRIVQIVVASDRFEIMMTRQISHFNIHPTTRTVWTTSVRI